MSASSSDRGLAYCLSAPPALKLSARHNKPPCICPACGLLLQGISRSNDTSRRYVFTSLLPGVASVRLHRVFQVVSWLESLGAMEPLQPLPAAADSAGRGRVPAAGSLLVVPAAQPDAKGDDERANDKYDEEDEEEDDHAVASPPAAVVLHDFAVVVGGGGSGDAADYVEPPATALALHLSMSPQADGNGPSSGATAPQLVPLVRGSSDDRLGERPAAVALLCPPGAAEADADAAVRQCARSVVHRPQRAYKPSERVLSAAATSPPARAKPRRLKAAPLLPSRRAASVPSCFVRVAGGGGGGAQKSAILPSLRGFDSVRQDIILINAPDGTRLVRRLFYLRSSAKAAGLTAHNNEARRGVCVTFSKSRYTLLRLLKLPPTPATARVAGGAVITTGFVAAGIPDPAPRRAAFCPAWPNGGAAGQPSCCGGIPALAAATRVR